mmetsp:Transcript_3044/g.8609  ORF Transcript_3044/g.8609 Transcript_3044/m.8609 type:complete len:267 (-) Transcript_3044:734-1534(-)
MNFMPKTPVVGKAPPSSRPLISFIVNFVALSIVFLASVLRLPPAPSSSESDALRSTASESSDWSGSLPWMARRRDMCSSWAFWACFEISRCAVLSPFAKRCMVVAHFFLAFLCRINRMCARFFSYSCFSWAASSGFSCSNRSRSTSRSLFSALRWMRRYVFDLILFTRFFICCSRSMSALSLDTCRSCTSSRILSLTGKASAPFRSSSVVPAARVISSNSFSKSSVGLKALTSAPTRLSGNSLWFTSCSTTWSALRICWICGIHFL